MKESKRSSSEGGLPNPASLGFVEELYRALKRHRIVFVWEADQPTARLTDEEEAVVTSIIIRARQQLFEE